MIRDVENHQEKYFDEIERQVDYDDSVCGICYINEVVKIEDDYFCGHSFCTKCWEALIKDLKTKPISKYVCYYCQAPLPVTVINLFLE